MRLNDFSLSARITAGALITVVVSVLVLVFVENTRDRDTYLSEQHTQLEKSINAEEVRLNQTINTLRQDVLFLSNIPPVSGIVRAALNHGYDSRYGNSGNVWKERLQQIFSAFSRAHPGYFKIRFIGVADEGREIVRIDTRGGKIEITPPDRLQTKGDRDYFKATLGLHEGQVYLSKFNLNQEWGVIEQPYWPTFRATTPVFTPSGKIFGMVMISMDAKNLLMPPKFSFAPNIRAYITNSDGQYLLHPDPQRAFTFELGGKDSIVTDFPDLKMMFDPKTADYLPPRTIATGADSILVAAKRIHFDPGDPSRFLLLAYAIPGAVVAQQAPVIPLKNIVSGFVFILLIGGIALHVLRRTFAPLASITGAADRITAGEQDIHLPQAGGGEIGSLTNALNAMLFRLSQRERDILKLNTELEERVKERTKELEQAQVEILTMLRRYKTLMLTSMDGIHIMDGQGNIVDANYAFCKMLGYTLEEVAGLNVADWEAQYSAEQLREGFKNLIGKSDMFETLHRRKDGTLINVEVSVNGVEMGGLGLLFASSRDITARKKVEAQIVKSLSLLHATLESTNDAILVVDLNSAWVLYNQKFVDLWQITDEIVAARDDGAALSYVLDQLEDADDFLNKVRELYATPEASSFDILKFKDGRIIERYSIPQHIDDKVVGRVWSFRDITESKLAAIALEEKEHHLSQAQSIAHLGSWSYDLVSRQINWSDELYRIYGVSPETFIPSMETFINLIHPDDRPAIRARISSIPEQEPEPLEFRCVRPDGTIRYIYAQGDLAFDAGGKPVRLSGTALDITEQKRTEFALRESEAKMRAYLNNISDTVLLVNASLGIIYVSPSVTHLLGFLPEELTGQLASIITHPGDAGIIAKAMSQVIEHPGEPYTMQHRVKHKDGRWIQAETTGVNMMGNPAVGGVLAVMRDITERKQAEEQLRIAAVAFETHEAILITDADVNIIRVNQSFTDITGYAPEEVLGKNPCILSSGRQDKAFYAAMWQQILNTGSWTGEIWDKRKNGQVYPKWLAITAVKDEAGKTTEYVAMFNDITARKQAEEEIHNLAFYDALTRLPNRRLFLDRFRAALPVSARYNDYGAVLFIDLDRFKLLNDTLGHDYGDLLLIEVAVRIKACVREMDTVARLGGDEFVVLIESISDDQDEASHKVGLVAEKIRESLACPYDLNGHEHHSSPSIGVSLYRGNEEQVDELLQHADMAMYQAKDSGRNAVRFFDSIMQNNVVTRAALVNDLRSAMVCRQLHLYYQLQVDNDNRPVGAEALLRWIHPQRGMVMPEQFLPIAEESTLILDIGDWVLETACQQLALWSANEKMRDLALTVNISAKQFAMPDFVGKVDNALRTHQMNPACLKLELTESMALDDLHSAVKKMHALKALGVCLSMDDFGTRYSLLSSLKQLPLDQLKLGRSFVQDIASDGNVALLVQSIIDLSSKYRITVIAEGVENEAQLASLRDRDCVAYQGFLFSKAIPIEEFERLLK